MGLTYGALFAGYGGLEMGVAAVLPGELAWYAEHEPPSRQHPRPTQAAARVMAHHHPDVPNLGDVTTVDWSSVPRVDILTGGFPCTDVSLAGRRRGLIRAGDDRTRSGLWAEMRTAIEVLHPSLVVIENVRGLTSAPADSDVEPCSWCLGDADDGPALRALGAVLGDLADLGHDAAWFGLRAADVGAAHSRFRIFVFAWPADTEGDTWRILHGDSRAADIVGERQRPGPMTLLPTPDASTGVRGGSQHPDIRAAGGLAVTLRDAVEHLLPTPTASEATGPGRHGRGGLDLRTTVSLMPTPRATDGTKGGPRQRGSSGDLMLPSAVAALATTDRWGKYAAGIARHEAALGRPAPAPTKPGRNGKPRLSPEFVEWLMMLPRGHVTGCGLTDNEALRVLGNGVVPPQAAAATAQYIATVAAALGGAA